MKEALLFETLPNSRVRCTACARYCNIPEGKVGLCGVRQNVGGKLQLLVYGKVITGHIDPIEKKPVVHFMPGSKIFSIATTGCNWLCSYCQNFDISQRRRVEGTDMMPVEVATLAKSHGCQGLAYTYNQPTIFMEFARDVGVEARKNGLINIFVSNGYDTPDTVALMNDFLDCITIDFKGNAETGFVRKYIGIANAEPIFETILEVKNRTKVHMEFTDLIVPQVGDSLEEARKLSRWLYDNLGADFPIHFLRFHPDYRMMDLPHTPVKTLEEHCRVAREEGLKYVYVGNVPGHPWEHTYCPGCGSIAIKRYGFDITGWNLDANNKCNKCGYQLPIVGGLSSSVSEERFLPIIN
ncbi:MAG TPA: AmmeMemoRadiSam system radical SAM enzyme [Candidatus Dormibacteraeota bacterium]|jgi:pyruvate formate lyase activating enzyme|nr:AmmeMemoRadiSam system radical SAM enzyme [Candidatus Dormibacteraeota bacterium]